MEEEQTQQSNPARLPQSVRMEGAKAALVAAIDNAAVTYGLTMPEAGAAAEAALSQFRQGLLSFVSAQYVQLARPSEPAS